MNNEYIEIFTDKLTFDLPLIQAYTSMLYDEDHEEAVSALFRIFHNYKASSSFLKLNNYHQLVSQGENILSVLRSPSTGTNEQNINWLNACSQQLQHWCAQLINEEELDEMNASLFPTIAIVDSQEKTIDIMKNLSILYADVDKEQRNKMKGPFSAIFKSVICTDDIAIIKTSLTEKTIDIFLINMQDKSVEISEELIQLQEGIALITAIPDLKPHKKSRLLLKGMSNIMSAPLQTNALKRHLYDISNAYFAKRYSIISHKKIYNFIQGLEPLTSSIKEISRLCDDEESSIKDISKIIKSDSISTANILHAASMPIYGLSQTSSVDQAVAGFGKRLIKALILSDMAAKIGPLNLQAYKITEKQFKQSSQRRLALMNVWYSKVDTTHLSLLCSCSILGNLGQILINQELSNNNLNIKVENLDKNNLAKTEIEFLNTTSAFVTSDILEFWELEPDLIDAIRYSDSPFNAINPHIQSLACANAIVYAMITPYGEILEEVPPRLKSLMMQAGLELAVLEESLKTIR